MDQRKIGTIKMMNICLQ